MDLLQQLKKGKDGEKWNDVRNVLYSGRFKKNKLVWHFYGLVAFIAW